MLRDRARRLPAVALIPVISHGARRLLQAVDADGATAASGAVYDGQARRAVLVKFPARIVDGLVYATTGRHGPHDLFDANVGSIAVLGNHAATDIAFRDDADQFEGFCILDDRRATAA